MNRQILWGLILVLSIFLFSCSLTTDVNEGNTETPDDTTTPYSPTPANGASNLGATQTLSWECKDASYYTVFFDQVTPPARIIKSNSTEKSATVIASGNGVTYYWKVKATFSDGTTKEGPIWHFTTSGDGNTQPGYIMTKHTLATAPPNIVKMLFQVTDLENKGIDNLTIDDFEISENGEEISKFESNMIISKRENNPYLIKTVLMLDNSTSISDDGTTLQDIKDAAKNFVANMTINQEVALYKFSSEPEQILNFTTDKNLLKNSIENINRGYATTNFYGAVIEGAKQWEDKIETDDIVQGSLVIFTDGNDTQGSHTLSEALDAIGDKRVYTVGLGEEIEPEILALIGNQGAYTIADISGLNQVFLQIQDEIEKYANSFYWMEYSSPKRGNNQHVLELTKKDNPIYSVADGSFSSAGFFDPISGIYINSSFGNPNGDIEFTIVAGGDPVTLTAVTYSGTTKPQYNWKRFVPSELNINYLNPPENSMVEITANAGSAGSKENIVVEDYKNFEARTLNFEIK